MNTCHRPSSPSMPARTVSAAGNSRPELCRASRVSSRESGVGVIGPTPGRDALERAADRVVGVDVEHRLARARSSR